MTKERSYLVGPEYTTLLIRPASGRDEVITEISIGISGDFTDADIEEFLQDLNPGFYRATRERNDVSWGSAGAFAEVAIQVFVNALDETAWVLFGLALDRLVDRFSVQPGVPDEASARHTARTHIATKYEEDASGLTLIAETEDANRRVRTYGFDGRRGTYEVDVRCTAKGLAYVSRTGAQPTFPDAVG